VAWPVFKTATEKPSAAPVGSIPTRSRHLLAALGLLGLVLGGAPARAQDPPPPADSARAEPRRDPEPAQLRISGVKPIKAFFMSLVVPGWAQARLDRKLTAGLFVMFEGLSAGMTVKTIRELRYLDRVDADSARREDKRRQRQDWLFLWGFNHLFSGLEAFVSGELHGFPADVQVRAIPQGFAVEARIPFRIR
jgi:hypothetical protein